MMKLLEIKPSNSTAGNKNVKGSFAAGISEHKNFGALRVPHISVKEFGDGIPRDVIVKCKGGIKWKAVYDNIVGKLMGLGHFMKAHDVKQMSTLILDYIENGEFYSEMYNAYGIELDCFSCAGYNMNQNPIPVEYSEFILGVDSLKDESARSLFFSSTYGRRLQHFELNMAEARFSTDMRKMILPKHMSDLYGKWNHGGIIKIYFLIKFWEVEIEVCGDIHYLGKGWKKFVEDNGVKKNDIIVFNALFEQMENMVHVCHLKSDQLQKTAMIAADPIRPFSFFHVVNLHTIIYKEIVLPILVRKFYNEILSALRTIKCGPFTYTVLYNSDSKALENIGDILENYNIQENDSFFFTTTNANVAKLRIYRRSGIEVDYTQPGKFCTLPHGHWFMSDIWDSEYAENDENTTPSEHTAKTNDQSNENGVDSEPIPQEMIELIDDHQKSDNADSDVEIEEVLARGFMARLTKSCMDNRCHGVYISRDLDHSLRNWNPGKIVHFRRNDLIWNIGITVTNGRKRFSAGWSKFVKENEFEMNDLLEFRLQEDDMTFDVEIVGA